jgi:hypothetical protein
LDYSFQKFHFLDASFVPSVLQTDNFSLAWQGFVKVPSSTILIEPFNEPAEQAEAWSLGREPQDQARKSRARETGDSAHQFHRHDW